MVKTASLFSQLLTWFPRTEFQRLVREHGAEHAAKGFTCWTQFVAMLFCQLAHSESLREICDGLSSCLGRLVHLGIRKGPNRSTLSYANQKRTSAFFEALFWSSLHRFRSQGQFEFGKNFKFKNRLMSLDSTTISLCLGLFPWAKFRRQKGGVKLHVLLSHDDYLPVFVHISNAKRHDIHGARMLKLKPGSIIAMDRGYVDYKLFGAWSAQNVYFVTRLKDNARYRVVETRPVPQNRHILADEIIELEGKAAEDCPSLLRRVLVWDPNQERELEFVTNHLEFGVTTIADIYKQRWQIELFFKALKQNLKIKSFVGTTENALRIQIWTALIAILLVRWLHFKSKAGWAFSTLAYLLRINLFTYRSLDAWLDDPENTPPEDPGYHQLELDLPGFGQRTAGAMG